MALSSATKGKLNKMNRAAQDAKLGSWLGTHTVTAAEETAGTLDIDTGNASATVYLANIWRAGVNVMADADISISAGVITVADGSATYSVTEDDVIVYLAF